MISLQVRNAHYLLNTGKASPTPSAQGSTTQGSLEHLQLEGPSTALALALATVWYLPFNSWVVGDTSHEDPERVQWKNVRAHIHWALCEHQVNLNHNYLQLFSSQLRGLTKTLVAAYLPQHTARNTMLSHQRFHVRKWNAVTLLSYTRHRNTQNKYSLGGRKALLSFFSNWSMTFTLWKARKEIRINNCIQNSYQEDLSHFKRCNYLQETLRWQTAALMGTWHWVYTPVKMHRRQRRSLRHFIYLLSIRPVPDTTLRPGRQPSPALGSHAQEALETGGQTGK